MAMKENYYKAMQEVKFLMTLAERKGFKTEFVYQEGVSAMICVTNQNGEIVFHHPIK